MSRPDKSALTRAQMDQLHVLAAMGATTSETAVDRRVADGTNMPHLVNGGIISAALVPRGFAASRKVSARYGEPARTLYWLTPEGAALEGRPEEPKS